MSYLDIDLLKSRVRTLEDRCRDLEQLLAQVCAVAHQLDALVRTLDKDPFIDYGDDAQLPYSIGRKLEEYVFAIPTPPPLPDV